MRAADVAAAAIARSTGGRSRRNLLRRVSCRIIARKTRLLEMGHSMLKARIADVLASLEYREREILRLRFGLADGYAYTLEEVGKIFSVTRERVRQIESKALRTLQHPSRARQLAPFVERPIAAPLAPLSRSLLPTPENV